MYGFFLDLYGVKYTTCTVSGALMVSGCVYIYQVVLYIKIVCFYKINYALIISRSRKTKGMLYSCEYVSGSIIM